MFVKHKLQYHWQCLNVQLYCTLTATRHSVDRWQRYRQVTSTEWVGEHKAYVFTMQPASWSMKLNSQVARAVRLSLKPIMRDRYLATNDASLSITGLPSGVVEYALAVNIAAWTATSSSVCLSVDDVCNVALIQRWTSCCNSLLPTAPDCGLLPRYDRL